MAMKLAITILAGALALTHGCRIDDTGSRSEMTETTDNAQEDRWSARRAAMVDGHLRARDITDPKVLEAMGNVPRHLFVPEEIRRHAYVDGPLPIGYEQTISQPYIVAYMTQSLEPRKTDRILEIGTGSGYQAAILAELVREVYTIEIVEPLAESAKLLLGELGYRNVHVRAGDGYKGWPEAAPFDAIIVTCAPDHIPQPLVDQLAVGGRLVIPVGDFHQDIVIVTKTAEGVLERRTIAVRFVPMTGQAQKK
jgi:protein-L-isoaspartate(D-aspartate) O-methyltransferase